MNPTILAIGPYRFFFFAREETRPHVHVISSDGEAKFWLEPVVSFANSAGWSERELRKVQKIVEKERAKFRKAWKNFFGM